MNKCSYEQKLNLNRPGNWRLPIHPFDNFLIAGHSTQLTHVVPTQPLPPGDNSSIEKPFMSHDNPHHLPQQQQQLDHIVPPPPDFKSVVDKLAEYVARNGEVFEEQIKRKNDPRFEFLNVQNIYFPYYLYKKQQCIMEIKSKETPRDKGMTSSCSFISITLLNYRGIKLHARKTFVVMQYSLCVSGITDLSIKQDSI